MDLHKNQNNKEDNRAWMEVEHTGERGENVSVINGSNPRMLQTADKTLHKAAGKAVVDVVVEFQENKAGN